MTSLSRIGLLSIAVTILLAGAAAAATEDAAFRIPVKEKVLGNGLKILVVENPGSQTVACRLVYKVGSANEQPGRTGIAHFLEHLMFKGTKTLGVTDLERDAELMSKIDRVAAQITTLSLMKTRTPEEESLLTSLRKEREELFIEQRKVVRKNDVMETYSRAGGTRVNAMTSSDLTMYIVTLPANKLELFMWIEADRLQNSVFREFHAEKDVVREERRLRENTPTHAFDEQLTKLVYGDHPYSWPVIGYHEDLLAATREDVREFFDTYYAPDNAVMVLVGAVKAEEAFDLAERYFGGIPRTEHVRPTLDRVQITSSREKVLTASAKTQSQVRITYYRRAIGTDDEATYQVLASLLSGDSGRLERSLVRDKGLAVIATADGSPSKYLSTFGISATTKGDTSAEALLAAVDGETKRLASEKVDGDELRRAKNALRSRLMRMLKSDGFLGMMLGFYEARNSWRDLEGLVAGVNRVSAGDVLEVAGELFRRENRVVGILHGEGSGSSAANARPRLPDHPDQLVYPERTFEVPDPANLLFTLENGVRIIIREEPRYPTVSIKASFLGGSLWEPKEKAGLAAATGTLMKAGGTKDKDEDRIDADLGLLAATIETDIGQDTGTVTVNCFDTDVDAVFELFTEILLRPAFRQERLLRWREERLQAIARRNDSPRRVAGREFRRAIHGDHPAARTPSADSVNAITRDDLVAFHGRLIRPKNLVLSVSGSFDRDAMVWRLSNAFGELQGESPDLPPTPKTPMPKKRQVRFIEMPISQGYVNIGHAGIRRDHPDRLPLEILNAILRQRINFRVRSDEGLAYSAYAHMTTPDHHDGIISAGFQTKAESTAFALSLAVEQIEKIRREPVTGDDLEGVKKALIESFPSRFSSTEAIVDLFAERELANRGHDPLVTYRDRVRSVTREQLLEVARKHYHPDKLVIQILGPKEKILAGDGIHAVGVADFGEIVDVKPE